MLNIHTHSDYTNGRGVLDSINKLDTLIETSLDKGLSGIALTDHDILSGSYKFIKKIEKLNKKGKSLLEKEPNNPKAKQMAEFKGIVGNEIYVAREGLCRENHGEDGKENFYHLILLAKNKRGLEQLNELSTRAWGRYYMRNVARTPTYLSDIEEIIGEEKGNVICSTACLGNWLARKILVFHNEADEEIKEQIKQEIVNYIEYMKGIFGEDHFYLELQPNTKGDQVIYNKWLVAFAEHTNTPLICSTDAHYPTAEWREVHHAYLNSQPGKERETEGFYDYTYLMDKTELVELFSTHLEEKHINEAIANTIKVGAMVEHYSLYRDPVIPKIPFEEEEKWDSHIHKYDRYEYFNKFSHSSNDNRFFMHKLILGIEKFIDKGWIENEEVMLERVNEELEQIWVLSERLNQDLATYFTTMQKMVQLMWDISIVAPGRGSAGAFMINYLLEITQIDPLDVPIDHPYARFLWKEKISFPDIDIDTPSSKREEITQFLGHYFESIGSLLTSIATFGTEKSKSALVTAARGLGYEKEDGIYFSSLIPNTRGTIWTLHEAYYGDGDEKKPVPVFVEEMDNNPELWKIATRIEGLINKRSSHAAGVVIYNGDPHSFGALMKSPSGLLTTQFTLEDLEATGSIKYDLLSTDATDAIQTELYLLAENGYIEWQDNLKATYDKYLHPKVINYDEPKMWDLLNQKRILSAFQFDTPVGEQAIDEVQPDSLLELATINSVLRLKAADGHEMPLIQYRRRKENINIWYNEMHQAGLTEREVEILKRHVGDTMGMCITQEQLMAITMDKDISNFSYVAADGARKAIGKKDMEKVAQLEEKFYTACVENGLEKKFIDYIWVNLFAIQLGYAFSGIHTTAYSIIAIQQMNLNYYYPPIFWVTARLMTESGSIDFLAEDLELLSEETTDEPTKINVNYFKMGTAMGKISDYGYTIKPPNINKSTFTFSPSVEEDTIYFGMAGISWIGGPIIEEIIANRPYNSIEDFMSKVKTDKRQTAFLIKSGAFDDFGSRTEVLLHYCDLVADKKKQVTLQNIRALVEQDLIPAHLSHLSDIYKISTHLKKYFKFGDTIVPDDNMWNYVRMIKYPHIQVSKDNEEYINLVEWNNWYKAQMIPLKAYVKEEQLSLLQSINENAVQELVNKYAVGNESAWEMDALSYYASKPHELTYDEYSHWLGSLEVCNFNDLPEEPVVVWEGANGGRKFELSRIVGTSIGRDKQKRLVGLLTPDGFIKIKVHNAMFARLDRQIKDENGIESSWFGKGNKLLISGYRNGDDFIVKTYKNHPYGQAIYKIEEPGLLVANRKGEI